MKIVGVLGLQGAVTEHIAQLNQLGVEAVEVKKPSQLDQLNGLIIPGGESTAISRLLEENNLINPIKKFATEGKGVLGTCAGLILCGKQTTKPCHTDRQIISLGLIDITVERNGFGRQIDSFEVNLDIRNIGQSVPAVFIRAPYITHVGNSVDVLATLDNRIIMAQQDNVLVTAFHPELTDDLRVMRYFIDLCPPH